MAWYWWVLITVVMILGGYVKVKAFTKMMGSREKDGDPSDDR